MLTKEEARAEFWLLTKGILQDSKVEIDEAKVIKRWLEEHACGNAFDEVVKRLDKAIADGFIDRVESSEISSLFGYVLVKLREM